MNKRRLFTPGPTPVPEEVMLRMAAPIIHHRTPEFAEALERVHQNLQYLFVTEQPVFILTSSGTGAMETAIVNSLSRGDEVIVVNGGKFGERWGEICSAYGLTVHQIDLRWGESVTIDQLRNQLDQFPQSKAVLLTHSETSTGAFTDIEYLSREFRKDFDGLIIVDGITAVGAHEFRFDEWDVDISVTGSQKGLMIPPGLACITLSDRAWRFSETSNLPKFYFDLKAARKAYGKGDTPWTPAVTLVLGMDRALEMIRQEGREEVWKRHQVLADAVRAGVQELGLELFAKHPSNALTSVSIPEQAANVPSLLKKKYGVNVASGQGDFKGKIFRISHLGYYDAGDILAFFHYLRSALADCGYPVEAHAGFAAAASALYAKSSAE